MGQELGDKRGIALEQVIAAALELDEEAVERYTCQP